MTKTTDSFRKTRLVGTEPTDFGYRLDHWKVRVFSESRDGAGAAAAEWVLTEAPGAHIFDIDRVRKARGYAYLYDVVVRVSIYEWDEVECERCGEVVYRFRFDMHDLLCRSKALLEGVRE